MALVGMAQVSARYWLSTERTINQRLAGPAGAPCLARHQRLAASRGHTRVADPQLR